MMEVRKESIGFGKAHRFSLCCQKHRHVYAQIDIENSRPETAVTGRKYSAVLAQLFDIAKRDMGWLWHIREVFSGLKVGDVGSFPFAEEDRPLEVNVGDIDIGWPHASASKPSGRIDEIDISFGFGDAKCMTINRWCGMRENANARAIVEGQAFIACVKESAINALKRNKDDKIVKEVLSDMRRTQGRIVEDVWRMPVYEVVELLCGLRAAGVEVFHADEEMTWTMFLNRRRDENQR